MDYIPKYKYIPPVSWHILTPIYDLFCAMLGFGKSFRKRILNSVKLEDGFLVADIGCGTGVFLEVAKKQFPGVNFIGVDPDAQALNIAGYRFDKAGLVVELKEAFGEALSIADESIDVSFSTLAFHHMPDEVKYKAIGQMHRILKPGGVMVITDFGETKGMQFWLAHLLKKHAYTKGNLEGLIPEYIQRAGFKNCQITGNSFSGIKIIKAQK